MILVLSLVLGLLPLAGVVWIFVTGMITLAPPSATVDGLFMTLILLTVSACFLLNAFWEARDQGFVKFLNKKKRTVAATSAPVSAKAATAPVPAAPATAAKVPAEKVSS